MILPGLSPIFGELGNVPSVPDFRTINRTTILAEVRNVLMASKKLLDGVASIIADYRKCEIEPPDADHVNRWISQFDAECATRFSTRSSMCSDGRTSLAAVSHAG